MGDLINRLNKLELSLKKKNYESVWFSLDGGFLKKIKKIKKPKDKNKNKNIINIKTKIDQRSANPVNIHIDFYEQNGGNLKKVFHKCKNINYSVDEIKKSNYKLDFGKIDKFCRLVNYNLLKSNYYNIKSIKSNDLVPISNFNQSGGNIINILNSGVEISSGDESFVAINNGILPGKSKLEGAGSGVFATKDFQVGDIVEVAPILPIPIKDVEDNILIDYVFMYDGSNYGMALAYGGMYNHQNDPNINYSYTSDKKFMIYKANKNIKTGNELFVSYGLGWWLHRKISPVDIEQ
jgi:hypothetical protein